MSRVPPLRLLPFLLTSLLAACDSGPPRPAREPQTRPFVAPPPATRPAESPAVAAPPDAAAGLSTAPPEPQLPKYLTILRRTEPSAETNVTVRVAEGRRLELETRNVERLHIDRRNLPLDTRRSIILVLDGQPLEWLVGSPVVEFERSTNGVWSPVKPN